jgi:peptidoglycan hydrolase-like protein with peptidoglycan-binding domain
VSRTILAAALAAAALAAAPATAAGDPATAALQVELRRRGLYAGPVDGTPSAASAAAVRSFQAAAGVVVDGVVGPVTGSLLGSRALGSRLLARGDGGWDVAELQFALALHGFPSGPFDGAFGPRLEGALRRFQRSAGLVADGLAGPAVVAALRAPAPPAPPLHRPVDAPLESAFGPRGDRFHAGVDFAAPVGTPVRAAAAGRVVWVGSRGAWGLLVTLAHGDGSRTLYAHLHSAAVRLGDPVGAGETLGTVGATGVATGPHLHFEVRVRGAAVDPLPAFG